MTEKPKAGKEPSKGGRPAYRPTLKQRETVEQMKFCGESENTIARALGIDVSTLRKHFDEELDNGHANRRREVIGYRGRTDNPGAGTILISQSLLPLTDYECRGHYVPRSDRAWLWSGWLPVTTLDIRIGEQDVYLPGLVEEVNKDVDEKLQFIGDDTRELIDRLRATALWAMEQDAANVLDKQELRQSITASAEGIDAKYDHVVTVLVTDMGAVAQRVEDLTVEVAGKASLSAFDALALEVADIGGVLTATANAVTALDTTVGRFSASGRFRVNTTTTEAGASSTIALSTSATDGGSTSQAALFISAVAGGKSWVGVVAEDFYVKSGSGLYKPFIISDGALYADQLYVNAANIINLTVDWADITNINITSAQIGDLNVETSNLDFSAVTSMGQLGPVSSGTFGSENVWQDIETVTISNPNPNSVICEYMVRITGTTAAAPAGEEYIRCRLINKTTGEIIGEWLNYQIGKSTTIDQTRAGFFMDTSPITRGNHVYALQKYHERIVGAGVGWNTLSISGSLKMLWWKR